MLLKMVTLFILEIIQYAYMVSSVLMMHLLCFAVIKF